MRMELEMARRLDAHRDVTACVLALRDLDREGVPPDAELLAYLFSRAMEAKQTDGGWEGFAKKFTPDDGTRERIREAVMREVEDG